MSGLDEFTKDQRDLLVALPHRVGLWIGSVDSTGGSEAEDAEMQALSVIVTGFAEDFLKSEFVQAMMEETVRRKDEWDGWEKHLDDVPAECMRATDLLAERISRKELASFKLTLMEIATSVAMAYREFDDTADISSRAKVYGRIIMDRLGALLRGGKAHTMDEILNISDLERKALDKLVESLDLSNKRLPAAGAEQTASKA